MKKKIFALVLALLMLTGCGPKNLAPKQDAQPGELSESDAAALAGFSLSLLRECWEENVLVSPLSVLCALGMAANGAEGETLSQMEAVLGIPVTSLNEALPAWLSSLSGEEALHLANSLWVRDDGSFKPDEAFLSRAGGLYGAEIFKTPMDAGTASQINKWVSRHTDGMIEEIVQELPEAAKLCLVNALVLDAEWSDIYKQSQVREGTFTTEEGTEQPAALMYSSEGLYLKDAHAEGFLKPYKGGRWAFAALLPEEGLSLEAYASSLTGERLLSMLNHAEGTLVHTAIPKFESGYTADLSESLKLLGMPDAFDASLADFSGMGASEDGPLYISNILHKTSISVAEQGTKAGAATAVVMTGGAGPEPDPLIVHLDRPFLYMLVDLETNLPAFIGAVTSIT